MRLPRDVSGSEIVKALRILGYVVSRQSGSHIRVTTMENGEHRVTIPNHNPIKLGTLASILDDVASHFDISRDEILRRIDL